MTARTTPRPTSAKREVKASTPRINTRRSLKTGTPRALNKEAAHEKEVKEIWAFKCKGDRIKVTIPMHNGRRLLESMLRRFLQKESLMARVELSRAVTGGIAMRVDARATIRELDALQAEEENDETILRMTTGVVPTSSWAMSASDVVDKVRSPSIVSPLRFDKLELVGQEEDEHPDELEIDIPTMQIYSPSKNWLTEMEHPLQVTPTKPDSVSKVSWAI